MGTVTGFASGQFTNHAFYSQNGAPVILLPGLTGNSFAQAINDLNQIVGSDQKGSFLYYGGKVLYLSDVYKRQFGVATNSGAALFSGGQVIDLNSRILNNTGWVIESATGMNDTGQIVGYG